MAFAGLISPGLYQLNVTVPLSATTGDNQLTLIFGSQTSLAGNLIAVQ